MVIQWHRRVGTGIKMCLSSSSPKKQKPCVERWLCFSNSTFTFSRIHKRQVLQLLYFTLSPHIHTHSNFLGAKAKTITMFMLMMVSAMLKEKDLSHKHQINSIIKIIVIIWNKNENHFEELLYSNALYDLELGSQIQFVFRASKKQIGWNAITWQNFNCKFKCDKLTGKCVWLFWLSSFFAIVFGSIH